MRTAVKWSIVSFIAAGIILTLGFFERASAPAHPIDLPLINLTIAIDPGHGGIDPGCHRDSILEKSLVLQVGLLLTEMLEAKGAGVILTRAADTELSHLTDQGRTRHQRDLRARVNLANGNAADMLISLHVNAAASSRLNGAMVFYHTSSASGKELSHALLKYLSEVAPGNQNGALPANFFILRHSSMPSVLVELGFLSSPSDRELLTTSDGQQRLAAAITTGIETFVKERTATQHADALSPTLSRPLPLLEEHHCLTN